MRESPEMR
jgi:hypothetical protein